MADNTYGYTAPNAGGDLKGYNPDYSSIFGTQNKNSQNFYGNQQGQAGAFQGAYQSAVNALPSYQSLYANAAQKYNVAPLAQNATTLQNQILQAPSMYNSATQGTDTNQNQLSQMTNTNLQRLEPFAAAATNQAQTAQGLANTETGYGIQQQQQTLQPWQTAASTQAQILAAQASGFNQQQSDQLAAINAKVAQGVSLTNAEVDAKARIEAAKLQYEGYVAQANATVNAAKASQPQNYLAQPGTQLYNAITGKTHVY